MHKIQVKHRSQKAAGKFTVLVFGTITVVALYCAYHILPFYYYYYELQNQFESHAKAASIYTNKQLREKLMYHINKMEIPISRPEDLRIERSDSIITISLAYSEVFSIYWDGKYHDIHQFDFLAKSEQEIK